MTVRMYEALLEAVGDDLVKLRAAHEEMRQRGVKLSDKCWLLLLPTYNTNADTTDFATSTSRSLLRTSHSHARPRPRHRQLLSRHDNNTIRSRRSSTSSLRPATDGIPPLPSNSSVTRASSSSATLDTITA